jgi:hypothetical protein
MNNKMKYLVKRIVKYPINTSIEDIALFQQPIDALKFAKEKSKEWNNLGNDLFTFLVIDTEKNKIFSAFFNQIDLRNLLK